MKGTSKAKLKSGQPRKKTSEVKSTFQNQFGSSTEITDKSIQKIIDGWLDIKLRGKTWSLKIKEKLYAPVLNLGQLPIISGSLGHYSGFTW